MASELNRGLQAPLGGSALHDPQLCLRRARFGEPAAAPAVASTLPLKAHPSQRAFPILACVLATAFAFASPPDLDELLGLPPERPRDTKPGENLPDALDPARAELDRRLSAEQANERFREAVALMGQTADRLNTAGDVGIRTQRMQEDILAKLDQVIASAQQGGGNSSSSSSSSQSPQPQQQQQSQSQQSANSTGESEDRLNPMREGPLNPELQSAQAAWGALPERLRDALMQGTNDPFSSMYRSLTETYYRRLAEEGTR